MLLQRLLRGRAAVTLSDYINHWLLVGALTLSTIVLIAALRFYQLHAAPAPEMIRKLFHLAGGVLGLSLVWLFDTILPVVVLGLSITGIFFSLRVSEHLREGPGQVLYGVHRDSIGEFCFIISIALLFWLADGNRLLYTIPLLVLAVADTFSALIGSEYAKGYMVGWKCNKTPEGSVAFFLFAFFCTHVPILLWADLPPEESLLIAINISVMLMMAEAASWWGLDNIIIPLTAFFLLRAFIQMDAIELSLHLVFLLALSLFIRFWRNRTTLADDALLGAALMGYLIWAFVDWLWFIPAFALLVLYDLLSEPSPLRGRRVFKFPVILANSCAGFMWLGFYKVSDQPLLFYPYAAAFAANLAIIALVRYLHTHPEKNAATTIALCSGKSLALLVPSIVLFSGLTTRSLVALLFGIFSVIGTLALFYHYQPRITSYPINTRRWIRQAFITTLASFIAAFPYILFLSGE